MIVIFELFTTLCSSVSTFIQTTMSYLRKTRKKVVHKKLKVIKTEV